MKNKKVFISALTILVFVTILGLGLNHDHRNLFSNSNTKESSNEENDSVYKLNATMDLIYDVSSSETMESLSKYIAIVKIESIDGVDNYSSVHNMYVAPYTYGKMRVLKVLKGDLEVDSVVEYYRLGGTISFDKYYDGLSEGERVRFDNYTSTKNNSYNKVEFIPEGDINIESNKVYLVYLNDEKSYYGKENSYAIHGYAGGLREVKTQIPIANSKNAIANDIEILNNFTGENEKLSDIISTGK